MISAQVLSATTLTVGWLGYVPLLAWAASQARWVELVTDRRRQHLLFGTVVGLFALWLVRRDFDTGVSYHFIGMTAVPCCWTGRWRYWVASWRNWACCCSGVRSWLG